MAEARIKARLWVDMALRLGQQDGRYGVVVRKGDDDSGGVLVVLRGRVDGQERFWVLTQVRDSQGQAAWMRATGAGAVDQIAADAYVARQVKFDPDLWVLEFESPDGLPPFDGKLV